MYVDLDFTLSGTTDGVIVDSAESGSLYHAVNNNSSVGLVSAGVGQGPPQQPVAAAVSAATAVAAVKKVTRSKRPKRDDSSAATTYTTLVRDHLDTMYGVAAGGDSDSSDDDDQGGMAALTAPPAAASSSLSLSSVYQSNNAAVPLTVAPTKEEDTFSHPPQSTASRTAAGYSGAMDSTSTEGAREESSGSVTAAAAVPAPLVGKKSRGKVKAAVV